jgi:hypothetical protein
VLPLALIGIGGYLLYSGRGLGRLFLLLLFVLELLFITSNTVWRPTNPDYLGYLGVPLWMASAGIGALVVGITRVSGRWFAFAFVFALICLVAFAQPGLFSRTRHMDHVTSMLAQGAFEDAPPRAILVIEQDHWVAPLLYLRFAEKRRTDLVIMAVGLASSSWYWDYILRQNPELNVFSITGSGGRLGRIERFLGANSERPIQFESIELATRFSDRVCLGKWLLNSGRLCHSSYKPNVASTIRMENALRQLGDGSPSTDDMIADVTYRRGVALWKSGYPAEAIDSFLAGVPEKLRPMRGELVLPQINAPPNLPTLSPPVWKRPALIGDPGRNLFMASLLFSLVHDEQAARAHLVAAANTGLPEALAISN